MKLSITRPDVWAAGIEDRPAALLERLDVLADAGANLEFVLARRTFEKPGKGVVFVAPLKGAKQSKAARAAGFLNAASLHAVRVEGPDKRGISARIARTVSDAEINLRGFSATAIGKKFVAYLAMDDEEDARKVVRILKRLG